MQAHQVRRMVPLVLKKMMKEEEGRREKEGKREGKKFF
jgi:hypothetical protein